MKSRIVVPIVGLALCLPCLIPFLLAAGLSAGAFSAAGAALAQPWVMVPAAACAVLLLATAAVVALRRRARTSCEPSTERRVIESR